MVGERSRKPWTGDEPVGFDPSTFRQTLPWWIRHWCAKRFAKSRAFQQTRVSSNLTSTAKCVGGRAANATACRAVLPCGANTGGSSPSRRTKFLWPADGNWADLQSSNLWASEFELSWRPAQATYSEAADHTRWLLHHIRDLRDP